MSNHNNLQLFATPEHPCSYLPDEQARTAFIDPDATIETELYTELLELGFRRSGEHFYRPHCAACTACTPTRVPVTQFKAKRTQRRTWSRNQDLTSSSLSTLDDDECYALYERYINERHADGDMFPPDRQAYLDFLNIPRPERRLTAFRDPDGILKAVSIYDQVDNGLSAIYTFFDPQDERRSLGRFTVLWQIEQAKALQLPYLYLGFWIKACRKMAYKVEFRPTQLRVEGRWVQLN